MAKICPICMQPKSSKDLSYFPPILTGTEQICEFCYNELMFLYNHCKDPNYPTYRENVLQKYSNTTFLLTCIEAIDKRSQKAAEYAEEQRKIQQQQAEAYRQQQAEAYKQQQAQAEEERRQQQIKAEEHRREKVASLRQKGYEGYWEYSVLNLNDNFGGYIEPSALQQTMNEYALEGWQLKFAYTNEVSKNSGLTMDQNILVFERYCRI